MRGKFRDRLGKCRVRLAKCKGRLGRFGKCRDRCGKSRGRLGMPPADQVLETYVTGYRGREAGHM